MMRHGYRPQAFVPESTQAVPGRLKRASVVWVARFLLTTLQRCPRLMMSSHGLCPTTTHVFQRSSSLARALASTDPSSNSLATDRRPALQQFAEYPACRLDELVGEGIWTWHMAMAHVLGKSG